MQGVAESDGHFVLEYLVFVGGRTAAQNTHHFEPSLQVEWLVPSNRGPQNPAIVAPDSRQNLGFPPKKVCFPAAVACLLGADPCPKVSNTVYSSTVEPSSRNLRKPRMAACYRNSYQIHTNFLMNFFSS